MLGTGAEFAEAAAKVRPLHPRFATLAGRACRRAGFPDRAGLWFARGYKLALASGDSSECIRALLGYGKLLLDQGKHAEARRYFRRGARRAHWIGKRRDAAAAYHNLFTIAAELGNEKDALDVFVRSLRLYPLRHPQVPALAHDLAFYLLRLKHYTVAERVLRTTLPRLIRREDQLIGWATYARIAALLGDHRGWSNARSEALGRMSYNSPFAASSNMHLAEGARAVGDWQEAAARADLAAALASERRERLIEADARALQVAIRSRIPPDRERTPSEAPRMAAIIGELTDRLRKWKIDPRSTAPSRPTENGSCIPASAPLPLP